jgi:hypothetical protein
MRSALPAVMRSAAACCAMLGISPPAMGEDPQSGLTAEQQRAVGIVVAHPVAAKAPERIEAFGLVLDPTTLISDIGESAAAAAAEQSSATELARLHALHDGGAGASLKMLEAAQAEHARVQAQAELSAARFALHWGPVAALPQGARQKLIEASTKGHGLLLRADLPGRHTLGATFSRAVLDVDGILVPGHVLGALRQTNESQSAGLLIEVPNAPLGLAPGARIQVALLSGEHAGSLLPRDALLYDENGAYVYKQVKRSGAQEVRYAPVKVNLLAPYGDGWLVDGIDDDDNIVVRGAGVLWSLQGVGAPQNDDDDG